MRRLERSAISERELEVVLEHSLLRFGIVAAQRYERLIQLALRAITQEPFRPATTPVERRRRVIRRLHLHTVREQSARGERVGRPRHFIYYEVFDERVLILRIVHDARDQTRLRFPRG